MQHLSEIDRIAPTQRPTGRPAGYHHWSELLFVHWRVSASIVAPLLPKRLTIDTFDGDAWIGLVPFYMSRIRPWWAPPIAGLSWFCETNVRTYVHLDGQDPGVWFFSLDASNSLAVRVARWRWKLPYFRSRMQVVSRRHGVRYQSQRLWPGPQAASCEVDAEFDSTVWQARPGTLEHFLAERYVLYAESPRNGLWRGQVSHQPYPLRNAKVLHIEQNLLDAVGLHQEASPEHVMFSQGFDVEVFPLKRC